MNKKILVFAVLLILFAQITISLTEIKVKETELVNLEPKATDPDKEQLTYTFSPPLDKDGKWQTSYGDAGTYDTTVTVSDGELNSSEHILLIVEKKEEAPVIESFYPVEGEININEGDSAHFGITAYDLNKDTLNYVWELNGKKVSETNKFDYFTDYNSEGDYLLDAYVSDGRFITKKEWKMNVKNFDRAPIFMPITNMLIKETVGVTIYLDAIDPDGDSISYSAENMPDGASLNGNVFSWLPGYDTVKREGIINSVLDKYHLMMGSYVITFIAKGMEKETRQKVRITVLDSNRKPVLSSIDNIEVEEGEEFTIKATASDPDGDKITFGYSGWINQDSYKTGYGDAGEHKVKVTVSDGWLEDSKDVKITVKKKNRAPVFKEIGSYSANEGELLSIKLKADDPDGDELVFSVMNLTDSSVRGDVFEWTPSYDITRKGSKDFKITFAVSDGVNIVTKDAVVTVNHVNLAPEIIEASPEKDVVVKRNSPLIFKVEAEDPDDDKLSYVWVLGLFEKYDNLGNVMKRVFTTAGNKKVKVIISDGEKETVYEWNVKVV